MTEPLTSVELRELIPGVLGVLVRRGADFATAEDAVQEALISAFGTWPADPPRDPKVWLVAVAWRKFLDLVRADASRRRREDSLLTEPPPGPTQDADDTLELYLRCAHPSLTQSSAGSLRLKVTSIFRAPLRRLVPAVSMG